MSLLVSWGDGEHESRPLSTGAGWSGFGEWADALDATTFREIVVLWEHGYTGRPAALVQQLDLALSQHPPQDPTVHDTAEGLLRAARGAKGADHIAVTNGMSADEDGDEWDEEAANYDPPDIPTAEALAARAVERYIFEHGFTGTDKHNHKWVDGKQVASRPGVGAPAATTQQLPDDEKKSVSDGIDRDVATLPEGQRPDAGVVAKAKEIALHAITKAYFWVESVKATRAFGLVAEGLDAYLDNPKDLATKFGYNPSNTAQTANPQTADFVKSNLADELGVGISGHLVARIAAAVLSKTVLAVKKKLVGAPTGEEVEADPYPLWAEFISQLYAHLAEAFGTGGAPDAATVEKALRTLVAGKSGA